MQFGKNLKNLTLRQSAQLDKAFADYIFTLDLNNESAKALSNCADCRKVRFLRFLPNCIVVDFLKRKPVALAKFYKSFAIDQDGVFFNLTGSVEEAGLPVIYGLETKIFAPKPGVKYRRPEIDLALSIIKELKGIRALRGFTLKRMDVANLPSAGLFLLLPRQVVDYTQPVHQLEWQGFEVRIGEGRIQQKLMILGGVLMQADKEWVNIKYIDLRFKEPVIKLNNVKQ